MSRHYRVAYGIAKFSEVISWIIMVGGMGFGLYILLDQSILPGLGVMLGSLFFGLMFVAYAQLILVFIDTENNTRRVAAEIEKTNAMLAETIGKIAADVNKISERDAS